MLTQQGRGKIYNKALEGRKQKHSMKKGTRVKIKSNITTRAWEINGLKGTVSGGDPKKLNENILTVKLDDKPGSITETEGINKSMIEVLK